MKLKKHFNSFHPSLGFFLHLKDVISWFDADPTYYRRVRLSIPEKGTPFPIGTDDLRFQMAKLDPTQYRPLLKDDDLCCWRCDRAFESMPKLKAHLQDEFDKLTKREKAKLDRKRKRTDTSSSPLMEKPEKVARVASSEGDNFVEDVAQVSTSANHND